MILGCYIQVKSSYILTKSEIVFQDILQNISKVLKTTQMTGGNYSNCFYWHIKGQPINTPAKAYIK